MKPKLGRMPFGKHQGELLLDVATSDPAYLYWLLDQRWFQSNHLRALICAALEIDQSMLPKVPTPLLSTKPYARRIFRIPTENKVSE